MQINEQLQVLIYGQSVSGSSNTQVGNNQNKDVNAHKRKLKQLYTKDLQAAQNKMNKVNDSDAQIKDAQAVIQQYVDIKKCLVNFAFDNKG